jgi:hypothetical protein
LENDDRNKITTPAGLVGVVIVNWNGWQHTLAACQSLEQSTHAALKIIVVDNASSDASLAELRARLPGIELIAHPVNAGFAGGCNVGIARARALGSDYVFLLNNDALTDSQTVARLVDASRAKNDDALLGSAVLHAATGAYQFFGSRAGAVRDRHDWYTAEVDGPLLHQDFIETDFILGAALFIPARLLDRTGLFDERFFLNFEETDLCYRARALGIPSFVVPASQVRHHASTTLGAYNAPLQTYFLTRNGLLFTEIHATRAQHRQVVRARLADLYWSLRKSWEAGQFMNLPTRAMARAFWDYGVRRFGDCPAAIRRYDARYRASQAAKRA